MRNRRRSKARSSIPDEGSRHAIIYRQRGSADEPEEPRIKTTTYFAEPQSMKHSKPSSQQQSHSAATAPIPKVKTPAKIARERASFTLEQAARRLNIEPDTLRRYERQGMPDKIIDRASLIYKCSGNELFHTAAYLKRLEELRQSEHCGASETNPLLIAAAGADTVNHRAGCRPKNKRGRSPILRLV